VPQSDLRTVVSESGAAFNDAGPSIGQIIDTSSSFIETANANFDVTTALIRDSRVVLQTQVDKGSAIRSFSRDLSLFTGTVADNDKYLRSLIDNGSATANELRTFLQQNRVNLGQLINNLVTTNEVVVKYLPGIRQLLVLYPYVVAGGFTVAKKTDRGHYNAQFGLILQQDSPVCEAGYVNRRSPQDQSDKPMVTSAGCKDGSKNLRGAEKSPQGNAAAANRPPVATYDAGTGKVTWSDQDPSANIAYDGGAAQLYGADSWTSMLLQPSLADNQE
jgi:phospholipid/cholesterol/gamma-HCH transport system substrate-binding protein